MEFEHDDDLITASTILIKNEKNNDQEVEVAVHNEEDSTDDEKGPKDKQKDGIEPPSNGTKTQENSETETKSTSSNHQEDHRYGIWRQIDVILIIIITLGLVVTEIVLGILTSSLAIVVYGFYGACELLIFPQRKKKKENPHSYTIVDYLALFVHAIFLIAFCIFISMEVIQRFMDAEFVILYPMPLVIVGSIDVVFIICLDFFNNYQDDKSILSIEYLKKLLQDILGALAVVASGINILFGFKYYLYLDSVISLLIVLWILSRFVPKVWKIIDVLFDEHL